MTEEDCPSCSKMSFIAERIARGHMRSECMHTCRACGWHRIDGEYSVECFGIYYCPNPLCGSCGASWVAAKLPSKCDVVPDPNNPTAPQSGFTVDPDELDAAIRAHIQAITDEDFSAFLHAKYPKLTRL